MASGSRLQASRASGQKPRPRSQEPEARSQEAGSEEPGAQGPESAARSPEPGASPWAALVLVGRIARPHGLRGDVVVNAETDFVEERFRVGATLHTLGPEGAETLTITAVRIQGGRPVVAFEGFARIEDVERLAGQELRVPEEALQPLEPGHFYHHQLVGCAVDTVRGERVGAVERVEGGIGGSRLIVGGRGGEILIPLAAEICVEIDVEAKRIRIDPPDGLLDLNEVRHRHDLPEDDRGRAGGGRRQPGH